MTNDDFGVEDIEQTYDLRPVHCYIFFGWKHVPL